ncbi:DUF3883 domain-containing protein [Asanoa sp. NPDC049573]|uniref:protein NO VEIN domain-containing protein n=1 Tax=Asanoa sp. NPDC049573 TaxID=3155396 RepID=UPI0034472242
MLGDASGAVVVPVVVAEDGVALARDRPALRPQASGWVLPSAAAVKLEAIWAKHLNLATPPPARSTPRQGWQMDPARRKKVEDAAQEMLMQHFTNDGWTVQDVRLGNPYDAIATRDGQTLWLEAKGTETNGASIIATRNEVAWARAHLGSRILGILSDVTFRPNGEVDATTGTFQMFTWNRWRCAGTARLRLHA